MTLSQLGRIGPTLGSPGGQGTVYELLDHPDLLLKRYHASISVDVAGLRSLVDWHDRLPPADRAVIDECTSWPREVVDCEDGTFGVTFRRAPDKFFHLVAGDKLPRSLSWAFYADAARFAGVQPASAVAATQLVFRLAVIFSVLHRNGVAYGDLSDTNGLWSGGRRPDLFLIDCDAAWVVGEPRSLPEGQTLQWECPWPAVTGQERDEYKLALAFLRLYFRYEGPLDSGVRTVNVPAHPPVTREAADLLAAGLKEITMRPAAEDWLQPLRRLDRGLRHRKVA